MSCLASLACILGAGFRTEKTPLVDTPFFACFFFLCACPCDENPSHLIPAGPPLLHRIPIPSVPFGDVRSTRSARSPSHRQHLILPLPCE